MNGKVFVHSSSLLLNTAAISCGIPHSVGNGSFHANQYTVGSQVTYHCDHGYHLDPGVPMTAVCLEDGSWSNAASPPGCLRKYFLFLWFLFFFPMFQWQSSVRPKSLTSVPTCSLFVVFFTLYPCLTHWTRRSLFCFMFYIRLWRLFA